MPEIIQGWLGTKLGVLLDMTPERFGRNTKDGKLLANLLYNYGVIPAHILNNVKESKNYYECYNNLVVLKPWLRYIGVVLEDSTLQKMAGGEGSAAISVFYSVYLHLERKDRLHYLSEQKERRISDEACNKFKVSLVPERLLGNEAGDSGTQLAASFLFDRADMIEWHKEKCRQVVEQIRKTKEKCRKVVKKKRELGPLVSKHATSQPIDKRQKEADETRQEIIEFEKKHPHDCPNLNYSELTELQNASEMQACFCPSVTEARNIVSNIKRRKKGDTYARDFQQKMQHILLDEQWKEIIEKQEKDFEAKVCSSLLKQSQYEKQMASKLCLIRNQKRVLAENRRKVESLKIDLCKNEYEREAVRNLELRGEDWEEEQFERERIEELHRRLYDDKARLRKEMISIECRKIFEAWVDIAIRISLFRDMVGCQIPKTNMKDLKQLFFKDLPIFDLLEHYEDIVVKDTQLSLFDGYSRPEEGASEEMGEYDLQENGEFERLKKLEMDRQSILDEHDLSDYLNLMGSWMVELLFPDGSETEVKLRVLGYIVHKLLAVKYPLPNAPVPTDIKPMKPTCIVHGLTDETAVNMLKDLMEACGILLVQVDDAINFVLSAYREELSMVRDIDINFQKITEDALQHKNDSTKGKEASKKIELLKVASPERSESEEEYAVVDKETQTPRMIPDDDPLLSPVAEFGKLAFEALGAGDPVPDPVIASAVVAYVISKQDEYNGWVLLNYPLLYSQASDLEYQLTGCRTLPLMDDMETLEETEGFTYRGPWGSSFGRDIFGEYRVSKLVPKPETFVEDHAEIPKTYFDLLIKLKKDAETPRGRSQDSEEFGQMEKFYLDLGVLTSFEYQTLNFQAVKNLGKRILMGVQLDSTESEVAQKTSLEIFGSVILDLNEKWEPKRKSTKELTKKMSLEPKTTTDVSFTGEGPNNSEEEYEGLDEDRTPEIEPSPPKPGDSTWEWATGPQPENFVVALASLWENMEAVYIEDFKHVFFTMRVHRFNVVKYCDFVRKSLRILMRQPDEKQQVLSDFQKMFNEVDDDLRPDVDIKCELHVRVSELERALMSIADERKVNSMQNVTKVAQDGWVPDEMANLINSFLSALQLEADRSIDSCQVIMDYYISLQQKVPDAKPLAKIAVPKLVIQDRKYSVGSSMSNKTFGSPRNSEQRRSLRSEQMKPSKTRSLGDKKKRSSDNGLVGAGEFVRDILNNLSLPEDGMTPFHTFFIEAVQLVTSEIRNTLENCIFDAKKGEKPIGSLTRQTKNSKKPSETNIPSTNENLIAEWVTALENELSRFAFRSQLLLARGIFDVNEFLTLILNILSSLTEEVTEMYLKEIHSISECCKVFRCSIEREVQVRPELELKQEEFFVYMDDVASSDEEVTNTMIPDDRERSSFTMEQLNLLFYKLQKVAPGGEMIKRSLVYIFEDLRMLNSEVENCKCFPEVWNDIEPDDVTTILNEVYKDLEIVHWKDFIIYAMELPLPTEVEILAMRRLFRKFDPLVTELISRENYDCVTLWFEKISDEVDMVRNQKAKDLLYRMYQVNDLQTNYSALLLAFCKDENPVMGFEKALALAMGKMVKKYVESVEYSFLGETVSVGSGLFDETNTVSDGKPSCCPTPSTEAAMTCIPKEKIVRCECKDDTERSVDKSTDESELRFAENAGEDIYYSPKVIRESAEASFIPLDILSSLLKASFPSLPQLSILLDCRETFQETLNAIYDSLDAYENTLEVQKLISHKFIYRLLHSTNKFKYVKLKPIVLSLAKPAETRVTCIAEKPNAFPKYCGNPEIA